MDEQEIVWLQQLIIVILSWRTHFVQLGNTAHVLAGLKRVMSLHAMNLTAAIRRDSDEFRHSAQMTWKLDDLIDVYRALPFHHRNTSISQ